MLKQKKSQGQFRTKLQKKIYDINQSAQNFIICNPDNPDSYKISTHIYGEVLKDKELYFLYKEGVLRIQCSQTIPTLVEA